MKMYYAKSIDGKKTIQFHGETLVVNHPFFFEFVTKLVNEKNKDFTVNGKSVEINMKDYEIIEIDMEVISNEQK